MEGKRALLFMIFFILLVDIFWNNALRMIAVRNPDAPWARGLLFSK